LINAGWLKEINLSATGPTLVIIIFVKKIKRANTRKTLKGQYVGGRLFLRRATITSSGVEKHAALPLYACP
jgi:hypothetical protein